MGCPTGYDGYTASWTRGKLARLTKGLLLSGIHNYYHSYNAYGQRISKSYTYSLPTGDSSNVAIGMLTGYSQVFRYDHSGRLIYESKSSEYYGELGSTDSLVYLYDESGIIGVVHTEGSTSNTYYFRRNLQGDVTAIYNTSGVKVAEYAYDAWGNCTIVHNTAAIAVRNPIRYRGYYYDSDTGLYYLNARYYSPKWRRFISPDSTDYLDPESVNGLNLYCYCGNDPVNYTDPTGNLPQWAEWLIGGVVIAGLGVATFFTGGAAGVILGAAFYGAVTGAVSSAVIGGAIGAVTGGWKGFLDGASSGFMMGALIGGMTGALASGINIASGSVKIIGSAQKTGNLFHRFSSNVHAGKFAMQVGRYSEIGLDRSLNKVGLSGRKMPDVAAVARVGRNKLIEVVSKTQTVLSQQNKINIMLASNPGTTGRVVNWALQYWFYF